MPWIGAKFFSGNVIRTFTGHQETASTAVFGPPQATLVAGPWAAVSSGSLLRPSGHWKPCLDTTNATTMRVQSDAPLDQAAQARAVAGWDR
ncbi:MAG: hypothetical protein V3T53_08275 [Phycisphaerales bacterium]